ncbi:MAG: nucleoside monophosphate kinase [Candidatus Thiodiazotropha sp.]
MRIVILGAPGSGKRTQTELLANKYGLSSVMTGELVKTAVLERTPLGLEIKGLQDAGRVVTEDIILALLKERLLKSELQAGFILDGFPRNLLQALTLDELMVEINQPLDLILLIDIETDTLMERLVGRRTCRSCGLLYNIYRNPTIVEDVCDVCGGRLHQRSDDNEETVSSRIHVFDHLISPLITHYEKQDKLVRIEGNGDIDQVFKLICEAIDQGSRSAVQDHRAQIQAELDTPTENQDEAPALGETTESAADEEDASAVATGSRKVQKREPAQSKVKKKSAAKKKQTQKKKVSKRVAKKPSSKKKSVVKQAAKKRISKKKPGKKQPAKKGVTKKKPATKQVAKKKTGGKKSPTKRVVKKKASKRSVHKKRSTTKAAVKKKAAKRPVVPKKANKGKVTKKKVAAKKPTKTKLKSKSGRAKQAKKVAAKTHRSAAQQRGRVVKKSAKGKPKRAAAQAKAGVKKKVTKKAGLKKVKSKRSSSRKK